MKIGEFEFSDINFKDSTDNTKAWIQTSMFMKNVNVSFDLDCDLEEYKETTSMVIWFESLDFTVSVTKNHETELVEPSVKFANFAGGQFKMKIINFPNNPYTQLIAKEVRLKKIYSLK